MDEITKYTATLTLLLFSLLIPLIVLLQPTSIKYLYFDCIHLKTLQFHRIITGLFLTTFDINLIINLITRYQILINIEKFQLNTDANNSMEIYFFSLTLILPFLMSNIIEGVTTFHSNLNMAFIKLLCDLTHTHIIAVFGVSVSSYYFPYLYFGYEMVVTKFKTKCYYGLIWATLYATLRKKRILGVPKMFIKGVNGIEQKIRNMFVERRMRQNRGRERRVYY